ncbi:Hint domain-containing protein [Pantoea sp. A4]|uniref:Hint domain-containing protein n=1 Tax=Pantoea sp. A4 TaxID=1225184 RepID=UPI00036650FC|nr:Hint domain-containing protein [Pantoea sp. A4]
MPDANMSPLENQVIKSVINQYANQGIFNLDLDDPLLAEFYALQLRLAEVNSHRYPAFMQQYQHSQRNILRGSLSQAESDNAKPVYSLFALGRDTNGTATASALASLPVSATNVTQTLGFFDNQGQSKGKVALNKSYITTSNCVIQAEGAADAQLDNNCVIYTFSQTINGATSYGAEIVYNQSYPQLITNDSPKALTNQQLIKVCLSRNEIDCTYFDHGGPWGGVVRVPIKGSITYFDNIDMQGGKPVNAFNDIYLVRERAGGSPTASVISNPIFNTAGTTCAGNKISWDLDWLPFKQVDFSSGERVYYIFKVSLSVGGRDIVTFITNAPASVVPEQPFLNTQKIPPMQIVYGCLGGDSLIQLEDGSEKPLREMRIGEWVRSHDQRSLRVEDVPVGKEPQALQITLQKQQIIATSGHPFCTPQGILLARELEPGQKLLTAQGEGEVVAITPLDHEIDVFNLHLSCDDPIGAGLEGNSTFYANGILVGDSQMQRDYEDAWHQRPVNVLAELPPEWHQDYHNYLAANRR